MFQKPEEEWVPNPVLSGIADDDPEVQRILAAIHKVVLSMSDMVAGGPHKTTTLYDHLKSFSDDEDKKDRTGLLLTWLSMGRRYCYGIDYAKYSVALKRLGETQQPARKDSPAADQRARMGNRPESAGAGRAT